MAKKTKKPQELNDRFEFDDDSVPHGVSGFKAALFNVTDRATGIDHCLKLWTKTGKVEDQDLRRLWVHEFRQVQRLMAYDGAREVIVDLLEIVEDKDELGVLLEPCGQPLNEKIARVRDGHWLKSLGNPGPRQRFWQNIRRVVKALGIVHTQGLIHGGVSAQSIMTHGDSEPDFKLGGMEGSFWFAADNSELAQAKVQSDSIARTSSTFSFGGDWRSLGQLIAACLGARVLPSGDVTSDPSREAPTVALETTERSLLKRLIAPATTDLVDASSIERSVEQVLSSLSRGILGRTGSLILTISRNANLPDKIYEMTSGEIAIDDFKSQIDWVQTDLTNGATLLSSRTQDGTGHDLQIATDSALYQLRSASIDDDHSEWAVAECTQIRANDGSLRKGRAEYIELEHSVLVVGGSRDAKRTRNRLGPDAIGWDIFTKPPEDEGAASERAQVRQALILVQVIEAVIKALEVYPVEIFGSLEEADRAYIDLRALPSNDRDGIAREVMLKDTASELARVLEGDDGSEVAIGTKWLLAKQPGLGGQRRGDIEARFVGIVDGKEPRRYRFEIDYDAREVGQEKSLFLKRESDVGAEIAMRRRLRNIAALSTRVDLADFLSNPWKVRRSSRENFGSEYHDASFHDLDAAKQSALQDIWETLPCYFVVGPPGVGKTRLATEVVVRRFEGDKTTRMLISSQGHDALDNLQARVREALDKRGLGDAMVVRSNTPDSRPSSDQDAGVVAHDCLSKLQKSELCKELPVSIAGKISDTINAKIEDKVPELDSDLRPGRAALEDLVFDAANVVLSTANSSDIERLVEDKQQFDWTLIEEAARATGPELIGPLTLSGRRILIGDHHQLPPHGSEKTGAALLDHSVVTNVLSIAREHVGTLFRDGELDELERLDPEQSRNTAMLAARLLEPFKAFVTLDEERAVANPGHRAISGLLNEQRRMDPAISELVSTAFYGGRLTTAASRTASAAQESSPVRMDAPLRGSPITVVDFPHVSSSGSQGSSEQQQPRWHNPGEVDAVADVLSRLHSSTVGGKPSLAILSPYAAQVEKIKERVKALRGNRLTHLTDFQSVRGGNDFIGTVDSFQGSEADIVVLSLVRNSMRTGKRALGFLRDARRMNVALSRARHHLIVVGSLNFLKEAVHGVDPTGQDSELRFLTDVCGTITSLTESSRGDTPIAQIVAPASLRAAV